MRHLTTQLPAALSLVAVLGGCNKGPAISALEAAQEALEAAQPELERYASEDLAALQGDLEAARERLEEGHYTEALRAAQALPTRVHAALENARRHQGELAAAWEEISERLPSRIEGLARKVDELVQHPPPGMEPVRVEATRRDLVSIRRAWDEATRAFQGGDSSRAVRTARDLEAKVQALGRLLGPAPPVSSGSAGDEAEDS
jgi:DNA repair exonuclease SbcCD ATPase subunit